MYKRQVQGLSELPKEGGDLLIITKSLKDVMCCYEMGFNAIAAVSYTNLAVYQRQMCILSLYIYITL